jgi:hypothetical protein
MDDGCIEDSGLGYKRGRTLSNQILWPIVHRMGLDDRDRQG